MKEYKVKCDWCKMNITNERWEQITIKGKNYELHKNCLESLERKLQAGKNTKKEDNDTGLGEQLIDTFIGTDEEEEEEQE